MHESAKRSPQVEPVLRWVPRVLRFVAASIAKRVRRRYDQELRGEEPGDALDRPFKDNVTDLRRPGSGEAYSAHEAVLLTFVGGGTGPMDEARQVGGHANSRTLITPSRVHDL